MKRYFEIKEITKKEYLEKTTEQNAEYWLRHSLGGLDYIDKKTIIAYGDLDETIEFPVDWSCENE